MGTWEDKFHNFKLTPLLSPLPGFIWTWHHTIWNIHLVSWGQLPWLCPFFCRPSLFSGWVGHEAEHPLALGKHCSAIRKICLYYQQVSLENNPIVATIKKNWLSTKSRTTADINIYGRWMSHHIKLIFYLTIMCVWCQ